MEDLIKKLEKLIELSKALKIPTSPGVPKNSAIPKNPVPKLPKISLPGTPTQGGGGKPTNLPGPSPTSNKDPKKIAQQIKNAEKLKQTMPMLKSEEEIEKGLKSAIASGLVGASMLIGGSGKAQAAPVKAPTAQVKAPVEQQYGQNKKNPDGSYKPASQSSPSAAKRRANFEAGYVGDDTDHSKDLRADFKPVQKAESVEKLKLIKNGQWSLEKDDDDLSTFFTPASKEAKPETPYTIKYSHSAKHLNAPTKGATLSPDGEAQEDWSDIPGDRNHYFDVYHGDKHLGKHLITTRHWPGDDAPDVDNWGPATTSTNPGKTHDDNHNALNQSLKQLHAKNPRIHLGSDTNSASDVTNYHSKLEAAFKKENTSKAGNLHDRGLDQIKNLDTTTTFH